MLNTNTRSTSDKELKPEYPCKVANNSINTTNRAFLYNKVVGDGSREDKMATKTSVHPLQDTTKSRGTGRIKVDGDETKGVLRMCNIDTKAFKLRWENV